MRQFSNYRIIHLTNNSSEIVLTSSAVIIEVSFNSTLSKILVSLLYRLSACTSRNLLTTSSNISIREKIIILRFLITFRPIPIPLLVSSFLYYIMFFSGQILIVDYSLLF